MEGKRIEAREWSERYFVAEFAQSAEALLKTDPLLSNVRTEPRYRALLQKMNLPL
jgi:hypothetical protein